MEKVVYYVLDGRLFRIGGIYGIKSTYDETKGESLVRFVKIIEVDFGGIYPIKVEYLEGPLKGLESGAFLWKLPCQLIDLKLEEEDECLLNSLNSIGAI